jgi:aldose sugar dehydrogenase
MDLKFDKSESFILMFLLTAPLSLFLVTPYSLTIAHAHHLDSQPAKILLKDSNLDAELVTEGLKLPTSMVFLNPNEILVLEKDQGKVVRVVNGNISDNALLSLDVIHENKNAHLWERGLLGIAIPRDLQGHEGDEESVPKYVFLFYTEVKYSGNDNDDGNICQQQECEENQYYNRLYRYELRDNKLVNPNLLIDIPLYWNNRLYPSVHSEIVHGGTNWAHYPLKEGIHDGGALVMDYDNNVYLSTGDGGGCLNYDSCYKSVQSGFLSGKTVNKEGGSKPIGMGGILRVTEDGEPVGNQGILGDEHPLDFYYAYGIRNSFGIDFDPVTGKLWDTENGPHFGDEINLVEPGFNSGWAKIAGIWPVINYTHLRYNDSQKGYPSSSTLPDYNDLEDFNGKGAYSDPEFTWNASVGLTSIKFLTTDRLGKQYENDLFVADWSGRIYHFDLNEDRTELDLNGSLSDKVANSDLEIRDLIFAQGLDVITDMEVGPDGYLYVLSFLEGKIYRIIPKDI